MAFGNKSPIQIFQEHKKVQKPHGCVQSMIAESVNLQGLLQVKPPPHRQKLIIIKTPTNKQLNAKEIT